MNPLSDKSIEEILANLRQQAPAASEAASAYDPNATAFVNLASAHASTTPAPTNTKAKPTNPDAATPTATPARAASEITTWPPAARHLVKLTQHSPAIGPKIAALMRAEKDKVAAWAADVEAAARRDAVAAEQRDNVDRALRAVGAQTGGYTGPPLISERDRLVRQIYREQCVMDAEQSRLLAEMGVPFFGMKKELVAKKDGEEGRVGPKELRALKVKMLQLLEDLFREEA